MRTAFRHRARASYGRGAGRLITARGAAVVGWDDEVGLAALASARASSGVAIAASGNGLGRTDAVIAVGGSWHGLAQLAAAKQTEDVPVVQLGGWTIVDQSGGRVPGVQQAGSPADAVRRALGEP